MANAHGRDHAAPGRSGLTEASTAATSSPGKHTLTEALPSASVQRKVGQHTAASSADVHAAAARGTAGGGGQLPFHDQIQASFGSHDISHVKAHVGGPATEASQAMGAEAYATGDHVAFGAAPSLHTAAHEAAHVVQQRGGVQLAGGVGAAGDRYEQNADAVADRVVQGKSSEDLLTSIFGRPGTRGGAAAPSEAAPGAVQRIVMSTGGKRGGGQFYSSLDPSKKLFAVFEDADAFDQELLAARRKPPVPMISAEPAIAPVAAKAEPPKAEPPKAEPPKVEPPKAEPPKAEPAAAEPAKAEPAKAEPVKAEPAKAEPAKAPAKVGPRTIEDVEDAEWIAQWEAKQREVHAAMQAFVPDFLALDPKAEVRIRGSLASGIKGTQKLSADGQRMLFNASDFDIDAYVVSNTLYAAAVKASPGSARNGQIPGSKLTTVNSIIRRMRTALADVAGNRDAPRDAQFRFNVLIRSVTNANKTVEKDQSAMADIDLPPEWGNPLVVTPLD